MRTSLCLWTILTFLVVLKKHISGMEHPQLQVQQNMLYGSKSFQFTQNMPAAAGPFPGQHSWCVLQAFLPLETVQHKCRGFVLFIKTNINKSCFATADICWTKVRVCSKLEHNANYRNHLCYWTSMFNINITSFYYSHLKKVTVPGAKKNAGSRQPTAEWNPICNSRLSKALNTFEILAQCEIFKKAG